MTPPREGLTARDRHMLWSAWHGSRAWPGYTLEQWLAMICPSGRTCEQGLIEDARANSSKISNSSELPAPSLLTAAQREALEAALAMPGETLSKQRERFFALGEAVLAICGTYEGQARWLLAADARLRGAA